MLIRSSFKSQVNVGSPGMVITPDYLSDKWIAQTNAWTDAPVPLGRPGTTVEIDTIVA